MCATMPDYKKAHTLREGKELGMKNIILCLFLGACAGMQRPPIAEHTQAIENAATDEEKARLYAGRGKAYLNQDQYDAAIYDFTQAITLSKEDNFRAQMYYTRGRAYYWARPQKIPYDAIIADYTEAIALAADSSIQNDAYYERGWAYFYTAQFDNAIADFTRVMRDVSRLLMVWKGDYYSKENMYAVRGDAYFDNKQYDAAIADYTQLISLNAGRFATAEAYWLRGRAHAQKQQYDKAIADYTQAIQLKDDYTAVVFYFDRGNAHAQIKQYDKAMYDFTKTIAIIRAIAGMRYASGERRAGLWTRKYEFALDPNVQASVYENRGDVYKLLGKTQEAQADYKQARKLREN